MSSHQACRLRGCGHSPSCEPPCCHSDVVAVTSLHPIRQRQEDTSRSVPTQHHGANQHDRKQGALGHVSWSPASPQPVCTSVQNASRGHAQLTLVKLACEQTLGTPVLRELSGPLLHRPWDHSLGVAFLTQDEPVLPQTPGVGKEGRRKDLAGDHPEDRVPPSLPRCRGGAGGQEQNP